MLHVPLALVAGALACCQTAAVRVAQRFAPQKDSECSDSPTVARDACLAKNAGCMWLQLEKQNLCLPCVWDGIDLPCAASGSIFPQGRVETCEMACGHQKVITKVSPCSDVTGQITKKACYALGDAAQTQCMWTSYKTASGISRSMCGPCLVPGTGKVPLYGPGNVGPEPGSRVEECSSQCSPPPIESGANASGNASNDTMQPLPLQSLGFHTLEGSPHYVGLKVSEPYGPKEYQEASEVAAAAAGWAPGAAVPVDAAFAVFGPDPQDDKLPLIRTIASKDPTNTSRRYVLPPPGIEDMPQFVRIGMDNVVAMSAQGQGNMSNATAGNATALLSAPAVLRERHSLRTK